LTEKERIFCAESLIVSIKEINQHFAIDFKSLGFSFGARGKAGSIAHYEDSLKVIAFNRGWSGALIHELGHAIDYKLNMASQDMPLSIRRKYEQRLRDSKNEFVLAFLPYYMTRTEIFARMFERYCLSLSLSAFSLTAKSDLVLPELDEEAMTWFKEQIQPILKAA
jgi:hypothetical protein